MAKTFVSNEKHIISLFIRDGEFIFDKRKHNVLFADKPTCIKGEPKTDIFVRSKDNETGEILDLKISYKQRNADFIENKMSAERAEQLFGVNWKDKIIRATNKLNHIFDKSYLIYCSQKGRTGKGAFTLGWKFELLNVKSGNLSEKMSLTRQEKFDVYSGKNLSVYKKNSFVCGQIIENSGVANYIFEEMVDAENAQDVIDNMLTINNYLDRYPDIYYACKALNYRSFENKYDGNRPLSVFVDWSVKDDQLKATIRYDEPLVTKGNAVYKRLSESLDKLNIKTTDDITIANVADSKIIYR